MTSLKVGEGKGQKGRSRATLDDMVEETPFISDAY